jgi:nitrite reductase/ring-hydroxylating ferredoxin subunit
MFDHFARVWTPIERSKVLGRRRPISLELAGERVVLFRDGEGRASALLDRCPHRGVALSLGKVTAEGGIECPFHGWTFAGNGACTRVPLTDCAPAKLERFPATALPTREMGGLIWVYTGEGKAEGEGAGEPVFPEALVEKGWALYIRVEEWKTHWTRAMENMLDFPHLPFVHRRTIGRDLRKKMRPGSVFETRMEPDAHGFLVHGSMDGDPSGATVRFRRPNSMELDIKIPDRRVRIHIWCVPVAPLRTRMVLVAGRDFLLNNPFAFISNQFNRFIMLEDQAVVESSQPPEVPPPGDELSVASDGPTLAFRRYYYRDLRGSGGAVIPASRLSEPAINS